MGLYRLTLSLFVVVYHFGFVPPNAVRVAVYAFFVLSGALMALVLDNAYGVSRSGAGRFYTNRFLRLGPTVLVYAVATYAVAWVLRAETDAIVPAVRHHVLYTSDASIAPPVLRALPAFSPQLWSLVNEAIFYLLAPVFAFLWATRRSAFAAIFAASVSVTVYYLANGEALDPTGAGFDRFVYQNFFANAALFMLGMTVYYLRGYGWPSLRRPDVLAALVFLALVLAMRHRSPLNPFRVDTTHPITGVTVSGIFVLLVPVVVLTGFLLQVERWPWAIGRVERAAGNVAYGVFVNQFLAAILVLAAGRHLAQHGHLADLAQPRTRAFAAATCVVAVALATATYLLVEQPIQHLRRRVRGGAPRTRLVRKAVDVNACR